MPKPRPHARPRQRPHVPLRSACPIGGALDLLGDRWTLLVMRDLLLYDKRRFAEFLASPEGIATNILAERLERLERYGLIRRQRYQDHPPREEFVVTACGRDVIPVLRELLRWGRRHVPGTAKRPPAGVSEQAVQWMRGRTTSAPLNGQQMPRGKGGNRAD